MRETLKPRIFAAAALALAITMTACTAGAEPGPIESPTAGSRAPRLPLDGAALIASFDRLAKTMMVPGAAMLIRTPDGDISAAYGTTALGGSVPVSLEDHIRVGSTTKTWTATVILQLVQEGRIALDDPVSKYRPDVPNGDDITIEQLLNMRSGLFSYTETYQLLHDMDVDPQSVWDPEQLLALGAGLPPYFEPGAGFHYSNTNYVLLGLIAEQLERKPLREIFQERLIAPLGLTETSFPAIDDASLPTPYASGYMYTDNVRTITTFRLPADLLAQAEAGTLLPNDQTDANPSWAWAAGAGISTIGDLAVLIEAIVGGGLLDSDLQEQRLQNVVPPEPGSPSAYGWGIIRAPSGFYEHGGLINGYNTYSGYDPLNEVTVVVWTNLSTAANGAPPAATIAKDLIEQIYGPPAETAGPNPGDAP
ncbi:serine hydrolase [Microbacterium sp. cf046]|uniref:serine hydrolase domain-containing protein n=1 Tax=Microbacterium sp. cf046 TaxID=1761803 RepID=UPI0020C8E918|nr:serine hydrolase domain-containing protein [Microbacterium sp. cf046]